jgi:beta-lactamase class A
MVKVPILIGTFDALERGRLSFDQPLVYTDSLLYEGHDLIGALEDSPPSAQQGSAPDDHHERQHRVALAQGLVGGCHQSWLAANGFDSTRVNSRVPGERMPGAGTAGDRRRRGMAELL